jgi:hypothetical protein
MTIEYFERDAPSQDVVEALYRDGAAAVRDQLSGVGGAAAVSR